MRNGFALIVTSSALLAVLIVPAFAATGTDQPSVGRQHEAKLFQSAKWIWIPRPKEDDQRNQEQQKGGEEQVPDTVVLLDGKE